MTFQEAKEWLEADGYVVTKREAVDRIADALERLADAACLLAPRKNDT